MTDAELSHARALESLSNRAESSRASIDLPSGLLPEIAEQLQAKVAELKSEKEIDRTFRLIAEMEQSELNSIFDSLVRGLAQANLAHLELTTRQHIQAIKEAADRFALSSQARAAVAELLVKDRQYYRLFTD